MNLKPVVGGIALLLIPLVAADPAGVCTPAGCGSVDLDGTILVFSAGAGTEGLAEAYHDVGAQGRVDLGSREADLYAELIEGDEAGETPFQWAHVHAGLP